MMMAREHARPEITDDDAWMRQAACRDSDPNLFHPTSITVYGASRQRPQHEQASIAQAKAICATCPVGGECERAAPDDTMSIRNGKLPEERNQRPTRINGTITCGTDAGYRAHYRRGDRGDNVCGPCREAHVVARNEWTERRMAASTVAP